MSDKKLITEIAKILQEPYLNASQKVEQIKKLVFGESK